MSVDIVFGELDNAKKLINESQRRAPQAIRSAASRSLIAGRKTLSVGIRSQYSVSAGYIKSHTRIKRASGGSSDGALIVSGRPIDLMEFSPSISKRGMVSVKVTKSRKTLKHSFFVATKSGLYHRVTEKRFPIKREYTLSVPQMAGNVNVSEQVQERIKVVFEDRLKHALTYGSGRGYD